MYYYTYVLYSKSLDKIYIGYTDNLERRLKEHKSNKTVTTSKTNDWIIVYYEACFHKRDAQDREKKLKTGFGRGYIKRRLAHFYESKLRARSSAG